VAHFGLRHMIDNAAVLENFREALSLCNLCNSFVGSDFWVRPAEHHKAPVSAQRFPRGATGLSGSVCSLGGAFSHRKSHTENSFNLPSTGGSRPFGIWSASDHEYRFVGKLSWCIRNIIYPTISSAPSFSHPSYCKLIGTHDACVVFATVKIAVGMK